MKNTKEVIVKAVKSAFTRRNVLLVIGTAAGLAVAAWAMTGNNEQEVVVDDGLSDDEALESEALEATPEA